MCVACEPFYQTKRLKGVALTQLHECGCVLLWLDTTEHSGRRILFGCEAVQNSDARRERMRIPYPEFTWGCRSHPLGKAQARATLRVFRSMRDYFLGQPNVCSHYPNVSAESASLLKQLLRSQHPTRR